MTDARDWTGRTGDVWAAEWARTDRSFAALAPALDDAIDAALDRVVAEGRSAGVAKVVDIGCGAGATALALARRHPDVDVVGIDLSAELVAVARAHGADAANARFEVGAVEALVAEQAPVDLFVSRHGVMFFDDPPTAFAALRTAAAPGGRIVFSCFRSVAENPWASLLSAGNAQPPTADAQSFSPGPFAFADRDRVAALLHSAGWRDAAATPVDYAYRAGAGDDPVADAIDFFKRIGPAARALREAEPEERATMLAMLHDRLAAARRGDVVDFPAAAWLWSARA